MQSPHTQRAAQKAFVHTKPPHEYFSVGWVFPPFNMSNCSCEENYNTASSFLWSHAMLRFGKQMWVPPCRHNGDSRLDRLRASFNREAVIQKTEPADSKKTKTQARAHLRTDEEQDIPKSRYITDQRSTKNTGRDTQDAGLTRRNWRIDKDAETY